MIPSTKAPVFLQKITERQPLAKAIFTRLWSPASTKALVTRATRELSQYYLWLQKTDKPW
jgi:hypothetical protein